MLPYDIHEAAFDKEKIRQYSARQMLKNHVSYNPGEQIFCIQAIIA